MGFETEADELWPVQKTYNEDISYHGGYANYNFAWQLAKLEGYGTLQA